MTQTPVSRPHGDGTTEPTGRLLEVRDLHVEFHSRDGVAKAINGVDLHLDQGETLAILGESGSGKSVTAQAIMGILDMPPARIPQGQVLFQGRDLLTMKPKERRKLRGPGISMIFQDALSSLNPVFPVGWQIAEMFRVHRGTNRSDAKAETIRLMERVRIPGAKQRVNAFPHQFSGGMRQRIMIAMAIALDPKVLIADEPTTALDVTVQAQVMELLAELRDEADMGLILITHDLGVVADIADRINVMYAGSIMEAADVLDLYARPGHPYTQGLLDSIPRLDMKGNELFAIKGLPPNLLEMPPGCPFAPRCEHRQSTCDEGFPPVIDLGGNHRSACHFAKEIVRG